MDSIPDLLEGLLPRVDRLPPAAWIPHRQLSAHRHFYGAIGLFPMKILEATLGQFKKLAVSF
jgi:hypothetical protein